MSTGQSAIETVEAANAGAPVPQAYADEKRLSIDKSHKTSHSLEKSGSIPSKEYIDHGLNEEGLEHPTEEELHTLRRVSGKVPWTAYTVAFVELCERFSYYGTTAVCKLHPLSNFA